ncbi:MAG: adenylate/guanylate cyclase domain-containing protein [Proteobacteria bacterium]|nr:adenylate/guanylate cyclase domain-containing protein [Pseudomonadota bacterium]
MTTMRPAGAAEIAAIRRRYLWMATSIFFLDVAITLIFTTAAGSWSALWLTGGAGAVTLLGVNWLIARRLFEPIAAYLEGSLPFDEVQRRLTQLPLLTARTVGALALLTAVFRFSMPWWLDAADIALPKAAVADFITVCLVIGVFYFTYTYFVVSDYLAQLCTFIFRHYGRNLGLFFGSYPAKLLVALLVISAAPLTAIVVDLYSYSGDRQQSEVLVDVASAVLGVAISAYFITRSLLRPLGILSNAMTKVAAGNLDLRVPVTSNDQVGELTGQFNTMVEGLRERERIRETFGRYVDEHVAAAILRRQGDGLRSGEIGEATILFTDIEGFTTIAEHLEPDELIAALNDYLETVLAPIRDHGGVVNTFIGDGLFASFNMPLACPDHAAAAVRAAIDIQRALGSRTFGHPGVAFATRIGISTGRVIGGDVGAGRRMSFTLLGDTVNLAARLEELNKEYGTRILVSESTRAACGERFTFAPLGRITVRGRSDPVSLFSVDPRHQESPS